VRDRNGDLINQLVEKDKEIDQLNGEIEELIEHHNSMIEDLDEHKSGLHQRGQDVDRLSKHNNELLARMNDIQESLRDEEAAHKDDVSRLSGELNEREKEIEDLDVQMENMIGFIEELEQGQKERDERIADLQKQLEQHVEEDRLYDQDVDLLESRFQQAEKAIQDKENIIKNLQDELDEKSENTQQYQVEIDGLNRQLKQMQKEMEKQLHRVKELEQTLVESAEQAQEAQTQHENDLQELDVRFQETENLVHERTRQNADLKHRLEVSETRGKEAKALYEKEMAQVKEVKFQTPLCRIFQSVRSLIIAYHFFRLWCKKRNNHSLNLLQALTNKISKIERAWTERVHGLEGRLKEAEQKSRRDRKAAHDKMNELVGNQLTLKDKLEAATKRNAPFSDKNDLKQTESEMELRRERERNVALFQSEQKRFQELDEEHEELLEAHEQLKRQLVRRDNMITKALERLEVSYSSMIECAVEGNGRGDITVMLRFNSWGWCKVQPQNVSFNQKWYFSFENASI
jgi:chromosome segregation ATPase